MKHNLHILFTVTVTMLTMAVVSGCGRGNEAVVEALPCATDSLSADFIDADGSLIKLGLAGQKISPLINGYFTASTVDGVTVYKYNGSADGVAEIEVVPGLSGLRSAGCMSYGVIPVSRHGGHIEFVDKDGTTVASLELQQGEITECDPYFTEGVMRITTDGGSIGLVNPQGEIVVEPGYASLGLPSNGLIIAMVDVEKDGMLTQRYMVIDKDGNEVVRFPDDMTPVNLEISDGFVGVRTGSGFAVADVKHGMKLSPLPSSVTAIDAIADGVVVVSAGRGKKGLFKTDGTQVLELSYNQIRLGADGDIAYCKDSKWYVGAIGDENFKEVKGATIVTPAPLCEGKCRFNFVAQTSAGYFLLDSKGEKAGDVTLRSIDCGQPVFNAVRTDYPRSTTTVELPGEEEWTDN